jgi:hypothetical protein
MSEEIENSEVECVASSAIHWSLVQLPLLKDIPVWMLKRPLMVSQKVLLTRESIKCNARHPEIVIYDRQYIGYVLLQLICPLLVDVIQGDPLEPLDTDSFASCEQQEIEDVEKLMFTLTILMREAITEGVQAFKKTSEYYSLHGGSYGISRSHICQAYKAEISRNIQPG